jgi:cell division protein FtsZ
VTVIAAGFDGGMPKRRDSGTVLRREPAPQQSQADTRAAAQAASASKPAERPTAPAQVTFNPSTPAAAEQASRPQPTRQAPTQQPAQPAQPQRQPRPVQFDDDELDVPDFLK